MDATGVSKDKEEIYVATGEASKDIKETRYSLDIITETKKYEKIYGKLIVKYVDTNGKELAKTIETTEVVGTNYKTSMKQIDSYEFIKVTGDNTEGQYIDGTLTVTYIYEYVDGKGDDKGDIKDDDKDNINDNDKTDSKTDNKTIEQKDIPSTGIVGNNNLEYFTILSVITLIVTVILRKKMN